MRVIAGSARGRPLRVVPGRGTRPIMDRVKAALFDMLRPRLEGVAMLDLFAGSGSVGIEALSQGASWCTFLDLGRSAVATVKHNLAATGLADRAEVLQVDAFKYLRQTRRRFDLIYIAPPQYRELWLDALRLVDERPELLRSAEAEPAEESDGLVVVQIHPGEYREVELKTLREARQKRYGNTLLVFFEPDRPDEAHGGGPEITASPPD